MDNDSHGMTQRQLRFTARRPPYFFLNCGMLVDSHCHLNYPQLGDTIGVIARAKQAGVGVMQTISTKRSDFAEVKALAEAHAEIYCSIGIHPHEAEGHLDMEMGDLVAAADHPRVIGMGETGLDFHYQHSPREAQITLFRRHIAAARMLDVPVIIHSREADRETVQVLQEEQQKGAFRFLIHCFSSSDYLSEESVKLGGYISCAGIVTFKKADALRDAVARVPLERLLVETDAPYLAPEPHRGKPCEPAYTALTAAKLAEIKHVSLAGIAEATSANFFRLFSRAQSS